MKAECSQPEASKFGKRTKLLSKPHKHCKATLFLAACNPKYPTYYCVASSDHQSDLAQIVSKEDEDADQPLVGEVAEGDQNR